jgi:hypothetical protein
MAAMLARGFEYPTSNSDTFNDDDGHLFEQDIQKIAKAGVIRGCNPPVNPLLPQQACQSWRDGNFPGESDRHRCHRTT